jgi:phenylacetate-CoA ligase
LLDRQELVEGFDRFRVYPRKLMWTSHSSGTSGSVVTTYRTPGSSAFEMSALQRQWSWFGLPPWPRRILLRRDDPDTDGIGALTRQVPGSRQLVVSSYRLDSVDLDQLLEEMRAFQPQAVEGWPSSIALLASLLRDYGAHLPVAAVITSSEVISASQAALIREVFGGPIVDHYGQTERVCMAGGCEAGRYHVFEDYGITELIPLEGRAEREIVGTPLHNWGFPLFRYRTGDAAGPAPEGRCSCGRDGFALLGPLDGRVEDSFTTADGRELPLPSIVVDDLEGLREVQIAQLAPGRFELRMVPADNADLAMTRKHALENVAQYFGSGQTVTFRILDRIPRSPSGKLKSAIVIGATGGSLTAP